MYLVMYVCLCMHVCSRRAAKLTTTDLVYGCAHGRAGKRREEKSVNGALKIRSRVRNRARVRGKREKEKESAPEEEKTGSRNKVDMSRSAKRCTQ